ncbi:MAG: large conductance mechanosensitive channel protein MscL [Candidatus Eisenbacteria bacterium]|uniref:Large-conductance mechanosensitive channel n=1 Tax=Eiseniibacteriota bacterium TaxID=2212470 RepID=A0A849SJL7_UNCEI|nr:large conductance mechanosensitive channel protein MscL [Candidatus Eisenbacteria bacterium]
MLNEFRSFLTKSNALALAIGVIIGGAVGKVVGSLVDNILMPLIGLALPGGAWRETKVVLKANPDGSAAAALGVGPLLGSVVDFVIIAFVVFMIGRALIKPDPPAAAAAPTKVCPACKESIAVDASRCRACTSPV